MVVVLGWQSYVFQQSLRSRRSLHESAAQQSAAYGHVCSSRCRARTWTPCFHNVLELYDFYRVRMKFTPQLFVAGAQWPLYTLAVAGGHGGQAMVQVRRRCTVDCDIVSTCVFFFRYQLSALRKNIVGVSVVDTLHTSRVCIQLPLRVR